MKMVRITWKDTHEWNSWMDKKDAIQKASELDLLCYSVGYLVEEKDDRYIICRSETSDLDSLGPSVDGILIIPKTATIEIKQLKE